MIEHGLLPLVAVFIEPAKVLFLNNAINHGIFSPIGIEQARQTGQSIMFLLETNPGPGLGVLLAYWAFARGAARSSAPGAIVIQFFGGIHEIYFPYVLMRPAIIVAPIVGSAAAILFYSLTGTGLTAVASPGSIIAVAAMAPKGETLLVLAGVVVAAAVSFFVAAPIVKRAHLEEVKPVQKPNGTVIGGTSRAPRALEGPIRTVVFACDAGMGSSAMGATRFRKRIEPLGSGVREGLSFYLKPDFSGITFKSVLVAMGQAFYSLSLGMGIMITYGSYTGKEVNLVRSTAMICIFDTLVALIAGLAIFPSVAHFDPALLGSSKGVALMFIILPQVFESMGGVGQVVSFAFFVMVDIAAITSVVSLIEVVTQFVIQKFHAHRKRAALIVAGVCFLVSIPIGISLGHVAILEEASPALFGLDWLTFFDEVTNTVLMPVCALFSCIVVGWFITPRRAVAEIEAGGTPMAGWLKKVYAVMIRFVTPALILIVEIGGLQSEIAAGNVAVIVFAYALVALCVAAYFLFFRNTDTGTNADEKLSGDYPV